MARAAASNAIDADPSNAANYASGVAFLLQVGAYRDALDIVHRALTQSDVSEFYRVYKGRAVSQVVGYASTRYGRAGLELG